MRIRTVVIGIILLLTAWPQLARAQQPSDGSICVIAYNDANKNRSRDAGEGALPDISVDLMLNQNVIVANHVTDGTEPFCFSNLTPQQYTVSFSSPLYDATTLTTFTFSLSAGEPITREFGAILKASPSDATPVPTGLSIPMTSPVRIGLSALVAVIVMALIGAVGMILYSLFVRR